VAAHQEKAAKPPLKAQTGWSFWRPSATHGIYKNAVCLFSLGSTACSATASAGGSVASVFNLKRRYLAVPVSEGSSWNSRKIGNITIHQNTLSSESSVSIDKSTRAAEDANR
jgi:hypothetical protein